MEEAVGVECRLVLFRTLVVTLGDGRAFQQYLTVLAYLYLYAIDGPANRADGIALVQMVARHRGKALRQAIAHDHAYAYAVHKLLHVGRDVSSSRREYIGMLKAYLRPDKAQHGLVGDGILKAERQRRTLALGEIVYIIFLADVPSLIEHLLLHAARAVNLRPYSLVDLLPETRHARHARGMGLAHRLLNLVRVGVDNESAALADGQISPATLKDMRERQEIDDTVFLGQWHALVVCLQRGGVLSIGKHHALRVARGAAGIEDVAKVIVVGFLPKGLYLTLVGQVLAELEEVVEIHCLRVVHAQAHMAVEHDDAFQRRTNGMDVVSLVVLLLLAHEDETHAGVVDHILHLLARRGGVERNGYHAYAIGSEVGVKILCAVLGEDGYFVLWLQAKGKERVADLLDIRGKLVP